jgi:hypothetical protein
VYKVGLHIAYDGRNRHLIAGVAPRSGVGNPVNVGTGDCQHDGYEPLCGHAAQRPTAKEAPVPRPRSSISIPPAVFVGVAFIVATMFLGVSHAGEWTDYIPPCPDEFVKAWDAWDQSDPAKMPSLPQEPCLLISWNHAYICSQEEGGCDKREF